MTMTDKFYPITIALAGICQSALLVPQLANSGQCNNHLYDISLKSILNTSPKNTEDVFGGLANIHSGLQFLIKFLSHYEKHDKDKAEVIRYIFSTIRISSKLMKKSSALEQIAQRLQRIQPLYKSDCDESIQEQRDQLSYALAGIYSDIISPLTTKINVNGKIEFLQHSSGQAKVRSALFGSVRAAVLWYQVGGSRWQFIFSRQKIIKTANAILQQLNNIAD